MVELTVRLAREMLEAAGLRPGPGGGAGGRLGHGRLAPMITAQGGDPDAPLPGAARDHGGQAPASGVLSRLDAYAVGVAAWRLGAGRARKEDPVSFGAGITLHAKPGDPVT